MGEENINGQLGELSEQIDGVATTVDEIKTILVGNTKTPEKKGLLERIRLVEDWMAQRKWIERILFGILIAEVIGLLFYFAKQM